VSENAAQQSKSVKAPHPPLTIGITMGEPAGIGPEIVVKALADPSIRALGRFVVYGMNELMAYAADRSEIEPFWWRVQHDSPRLAHELTHDCIVLDYDEFSLLGQAIHQPTREGGLASLAFLKDAVAAARKDPGMPGRIDALVTAPICKASWHLAGCKWPGHTELLAALTGAKRSVMMFCAPKLNVALATIHIPLLTLENELTIGRIYDPIDLGHQACLALGIESPRIAVCGMNPHASEGGLFGDEETRLIEPAISAAREHGIPVKLLAFDDAVNMTLGLPIVRTSPDHGTAFDIVGQGRANAASLKAAIRLAAQVARYGPIMHGAERPKPQAERRKP